MDRCTHENIINGVCKMCGLHIDGGMAFDNTDYYYNSNEKKGANTNLFIETIKQNQNISEEVKNWIFTKTERLDEFKSKLEHRNQVIYALVYVGYRDLGINFDPTELGKIIGLTKKEERAALKIVSPISPIKNQMYLDIPKIPMDVVGPDEYIKEHIENIFVKSNYGALGVKNSKKKDILIKSVIKFTEILIDKKTQLLENKPQKIALAFINVYFEYMKIDIEKIHKYYKHGGKDMSSTELNNLCKPIRKVLSKVMDKIEQEITEFNA